MVSATCPEPAPALLVTATGTTQETAVPLAVWRVNRASTSPGGTGVMLPGQQEVGAMLRTQNVGAVPLLVYPPVGGVIGNRTTNAPVQVRVGAWGLFKHVGGSIWSAVTS